MIESDYHFGMVTLYCDGDKCDETLEIDSGGETPSYSEACREAREDHQWKVRMIDGEWKHYCPDCRPTY